MQNQPKEDFRKNFLLKFTEHLIRNSAPSGLFELEETIKEEKKDISEKIKREIKKIEKPSPKDSLTKTLPMIRRREIPLRTLRIPETMLPQRLQYLKPSPTNTEVELGKLGVLVKDPMVRTIECNGEDEPIIVSGGMGTKKTGIVLSKQEIEQVLQKFSETAKIPLQHGVVKIVAGRLILLAIVSNVISSKFVIKKMTYSQRALLKNDQR